MTDWQALREEFPALKKYTYLSTAGGGPMARATHAAATSFYDRMLSDGDQPWPEWLARVEQVRGQVAAFINADPAEIAFVQNTSHGMNILAQMLKGAGDVLAMDDDFPTATIPFLKQGFHLDYVSADEQCRILPETVAAAITPATRLAVMSSVQYATGYRQDIRRCRELCHARGVALIVDASQSICALPLDVRDAGMDYLVFSANKWGLSGYGIGVLYIRRDLIAAAKMPVASWMSVRQPPRMDNRSTDYKDTAAMLEGGGPSFPNIFALGATVEMISSIGQAAIERRIHELTDYLRARLAETGTPVVSPGEREYRSGITIIAVPDKAALAAALAARRILVSVRHRGIRVALNFYNTTDDIDIFIAAMREITGGRP